MQPTMNSSREILPVPNFEPMAVERLEELGHAIVDLAAVANQVIPA